MVSKYVVGALCDALAEAAKERDLESIKEIYLALDCGQVPVVQTQLKVEGVLSTSQSGLDLSVKKTKEQDSDFRSRKPIPYTRIISFIEQNNILDRFVQEVGGSFPYQFSLQQLYDWIYRQDDLSELRQSTQFRKQLANALYYCADSVNGVTNYPIHHYIRRDKLRRGLYTYDPHPHVSEQ